MIRKTYQLKLATPAFLGDANQSGTWRTPPLKALLREWWRFAVAPETNRDAQALKAREEALFGTAADDSQGKSQKSCIRLALQHWNAGTLTDWSKANAGSPGKPGVDPKVKHSEVQFGNGSVGSQLYLGYGPLVLKKGNPNTQLKKSAALQAGETNTLTLAFPDTSSDELSRALSLANWFGTVGGRSRNGWGSLAWEACDSAPLPTLSRATLEEMGCCRPLKHCLELDWPHAIGYDASGPLVWHSTHEFPDWREAMKFLAQLKIGFRTHLGFNGGKPHPEPQPRHILAYPVTNHDVSDWKRANGRVANTLRFKLHNGTTGVRAIVFHTPCRPTLRHSIDLLETWQRVHRFLDGQTELNRIA